MLGPKMNWETKEKMENQGKIQDEEIWFTNVLGQILDKR